jgi:hypothetical protein
MTTDFVAVDYMAVLADLERRRDELLAAIEAIRPLAALQSGQPTPGGTPGGGSAVKRQGQPTSLRSDSFFGMKAPAAIKAFLGATKRPMSVSDIVEGLKTHGFTSSAKDLYNNLYTALNRMDANDEARKLPDGTWGLSEWYPARSKPKQQASNGDKAEGASEAAEGDSTDEETAA